MMGLHVQVEVETVTAPTVVFTGVIIFNDLYESSTERQKEEGGRRAGGQREDGGWKVKEDIQE